jgi:hypothetical protein
MKKGAVIAWLAILLLGTIALFWYNEWVYSLPTPVPGNYKPVSTGSRINIGLPRKAGQTRPLFLHFFNPDCPCSKFNIPHFKVLVRQYSNEADFAIVLMTGKKYTEKEIQQKFDTSLPVITDSSVAAACGVYSTPQAVIINADSTLYYRGNYNKNRYCTDKKSNYAELALRSLLQKQARPAFDQFALTSYGCQLPKCTQ